jgi:hypothetical protein
MGKDSFAMSREELELIVRKARMLRELRRAKERVNRLERELRGEPVQPEDAPYVPEFLRVQVGAGWADPRRSRLIENFHGRSRDRGDLGHEPTR